MLGRILTLAMCCWGSLIVMHVPRASIYLKAFLTRCMQCHRGSSVYQAQLSCAPHVLSRPCCCSCGRALTAGSPGANDRSGGPNSGSPGANDRSGGPNGGSPGANGGSPGANARSGGPNGGSPGAGSPGANGGSPGANARSGGPSGGSPGANGGSPGSNGGSPGAYGRSPGTEQNNAARSGTSTAPGTSSAPQTQNGACAGCMYMAFLHLPGWLSWH